MEVKCMRKVLFIHISILMLFLVGCDRNTIDEDIVIGHSMQTISNRHTTGSLVFDSLSSLSTFVIDNELDELDLTSYDDAFFEHYSLVIIVFDEDTMVYPDEFKYVKDNLEVSMIRTTESLENKTCFLLIEINVKHLLTSKQILHRIRDAVKTNGLVHFTYDRYNSQNDFAFTDWEHMSAFENNSHIINSTTSFTRFCLIYEHVLPSSTSRFDDDFFKDHTLLIIQFWAGAYYGDSVIVDSVLIEDHHATVTIMITNTFAERDQTIYSFWIVIDKNENITSMTDLVTF